MPPKTKKAAEAYVVSGMTVRCEACGHNWKMDRGDAFLCPYCLNAPLEITFHSTTYAELPEGEAERWR
jgi:rubrerythrin